MRKGFVHLLVLSSLVALVGCGSTLNNQENSDTPLVSLPPGWQQLHLPFNTRFAEGDVYVAPSDGMSAYGCNTSKNTETIWSTHDGGKTWAKAAPFPGSSALQPDDTCRVAVDAGDAQSVVVFVGIDSVGFFSHDSGNTWTALPQGLRIEGPVTYQGATYAMIEHLDPGNPSADDYPLARSQDGWKTWTPIQAQAGPHPANPYLLWLNPQNGHLLVRNAAVGEAQFWQSNDVGQTWTSIGDLPRFCCKKSGRPSMGVRTFPFVQLRQPPQTGWR